MWKSNSIGTASPQLGCRLHLLSHCIFLCCCPVAQSHPTLCDPMDCSTPGFPVLHYLSEFAQTHVLWVSDAIQPSHLLLPPSPPAQRLFQLLTCCIKWPKYWLHQLAWCKAIAPHSSTLAWRIPWTEDPGKLQSIRSLRVGHDWETSLSHLGEGNGNLLQYSCLENPRDGGAW